MPSVVRVLCVLLAASLTGCAGAKQAAIESAMYKIWNDGDLSIIDDAYEAELAYEIKMFVEDNRSLYPDIDVQIVDSVIKGNRYVTLWRVTGTHRDLEKQVQLDGVSVRKRVEGVFVEEKMFYDLKTVYDQLGFTVVPPAGASPFDGVQAAADRGGEEEATEEDSGRRERSEDGATRWPEGVEDTYKEDAVTAAVEKAIGGIDGAEIAYSSCAAYPCVVSVALPEGARWSAASNELETSLMDGGYAQLWNWPARVRAEGGQFRFYATLAFPADELEDADWERAEARMGEAMDAITAN